MWAALRVDPIFRERRFHLLTGLGRLARGVSLTQAQQAAGTMAAALARSDPAVHGARSVVITPLHAYLTRDVRTPLHFLLAAAVLVMLVACTNVSGILLTRTSDRWRELGTRAAIGAGAGRLARLIAADAAVLTAAATGLGVLIAIAATATARQLAPTSLAARDRITVDFQILGWCVAIAATAAMLTAVGPAVRVVRMRVLDALGGSGRTATPRRFVRHALVAAQIAGAVALLVCGLLLTRSFTRLLQIDPGFKADGGVIAPVRLPLAKYPVRERYAPVLEELLHRTSTSDGVSAAAVAFMLPLSSARLQVEVQLPKPASRPPVEVLLNTVSASYFTTMRVPIVRGRGFGADDTAKAPAVAIVSAGLARSLWGRDDVTGEILQGADASDRWQVVGVAGDVKDSELTADARPMLYRPFAQFPVNSVTLIAYGDRPVDQLVAQLRTIITGLDRDIPVDGIAPLQSIVDAAVARSRFVTALGGAFAIVAVVIAVIGLYAAIGYTVQTRTTEIGVRMALGATRLAVAGAVMRDVGAMLAAGLAGGVLAGLGGAQLIRQLLFDVSTFDLASVLIAVLAIAAAAVLASAGALRAAISVDPGRALHAS
jgi:putative ABC transport system permease protein